MPGAKDLPKFSTGVGLAAFASFKLYALFSEGSLFNGEVPCASRFGDVWKYDDAEEGDQKQPEKRSPSVTCFRAPASAEEPMISHILGTSRANHFLAAGMIDKHRKHVHQTLSCASTDLSDYHNPTSILH